MTSSKTKGVMIMAGLLAGLLIGFAIHWGIQNAQGGSEPVSLKLELSLPDEHQVWALDISADGRYLAYLTDLGSITLYRYDLETGEVRMTESTDLATGLSISKDGQWILLASRFSVARVPFSGGTALPVVSTKEYADASWSPDGESIYYSSGRGIVSRSLKTGEERQITRLDSLRGETTHTNASLLPDNRTLMFAIRVNSRVSIGFADVDTGERVKEIPGGTEPIYVKTGHLLYLDENETLIAVPFDLEKLEPRSAPVAVLQNAASRAWGISDTGTLVTSQNGLARNRRPLVRTSLTGDVDTLAVGDAEHDNMRLSPDGTHVVFVTAASTIVEVAVDGSSSRRVIYTGPGTIDYPSWSPDGQTLAFDMDGDIWLYDEERGGRAFMTSPDFENQPRFSPNGKYLALTSVKDGTAHIFVHSVADPSIAWDTSQGEGLDAYWSEDGGTIYYRGGSRVMMRNVSIEPAFRPLSNPQVLRQFDLTVLDYAVTSDDTSIIEAVSPVRRDDAVERVTVIVNFFELLNKMAPSGRGR